MQACSEKCRDTEKRHRVKFSDLNEKDTEINDLKRQLSEKDNIITEQEQKIKEIEAQIPACQELIQDLQQQLAAKAQTPSYSNTATSSADVDEGFYPKPSMLSSTPSSPEPSTSRPPPPSPTAHPSGTYGAPGEMERQCPNCGAMGFAIKEVEDRTMILSYTPKVYGKKRVCTKCSYEF